MSKFKLRPTKRKAATAQEIWRCFSCGKVDTYPRGASPVCCSASMLCQGAVFVGAGDPDALRIDAIQVWPPPEEPDPILGRRVVRLFAAPPAVSWLFAGVPGTIFEIWRLAPGREKGERIGWLGERDGFFEYRMVPGVAASMATGTANTRNGAVEKMLSAIQAG